MNENKQFTVYEVIKFLYEAVKLTDRTTMSTNKSIRSTYNPINSDINVLVRTNKRLLRDEIINFSSHILLHTKRL